MTRKKSFKWHNGPPPHVGWWLASVGLHSDVWRWWDERAWSLPLASGARSHWVNRLSKKYSSSDIQDSIRWSDYYPDNARVPRIDPRKGGAK